MSSINKHGKKHGVRLGFDILEAREVLSTSVVVANGGQELVITGTAGSNQVEITQNDITNELLVTTKDGNNAPVTQFFQSSAIKTIRTDLKAGIDGFSFKVIGGSDFVNSKALHTDMGAGGDLVTIDLQNNGGTGAKVKAQLDVDVKMGSDAVADIMQTFLDDVDNANVNIDADLGLGKDIYFGSMKGDLIGNANVAYRIHGGSDKDSIHVDALGVKVDQNARLDVNFFGGLGDDDMQLNYKGVMNGTLKVREQGDAGEDKVVALIELDNDTDSIKGKLDVILFGNSGRDALTLVVTDHTNHEFDFLNALIDGGIGRDICTKSAGVQDVNCER
jgi:hypothetical protein